MDHVNFPEADLVYKGDGGEVGDLVCQRLEPGQILSVWQPTEEERAVLAAGGKVELVVWGEPIPPVSLGVRP